MRKSTWYALWMTSILLLPSISFADSSILSQYQSLVNKSLKQPTTSGNLQGDESSAGSPLRNGQAALIPTRPLPQTAPSTPKLPTTMPAQPAQNEIQTQNPNYGSNNNVTNSTDTYTQQQQAPTGPPNIFITPGGGSTNNQSGSPIIHY